MCCEDGDRVERLPVERDAPERGPGTHDRRVADAGRILGPFVGDDAGGAEMRPDDLVRGFVRRSVDDFRQGDDDSAPGDLGGRAERRMNDCTVARDKPRDVVDVAAFIHVHDERARVKERRLAAHAARVEGG